MFCRTLFAVLFGCCFLMSGTAQESVMEPGSIYESVIFPDRSFVRRLEQADRLFESGRTLEAAQLLGSILESANFAFTMPEPADGEPIRTLHQTVNDYIIDRIRKLPKEGRESYAFQFEPTARRLLENGVASGSADEIQIVAQRYFPTVSGASAAFLVGVTQFERGDYAAAFLTLDKLKRLHPSIPDTLNPLLKRLLDELDKRFHDDAAAPGQEISEAVWLEQTGWRLPGGSPTQHSATRATAPLLEQNWTVPAFNRLTWERETERLARIVRRGDEVYIPASQPLVVGDLFITRTVGETMAVDAHSGKRLWSVTESEYRLPENSGLQPRTPLIAYNPQPALRLFHWLDRIGQQLSSDGERLFCIDEHDLQASYQTGFALGGLQARRPLGRVEDRRHDQGNTLTARELKTGRILWQIGKFPYVQKHFDAHSQQANAQQADVDEGIFTDEEKTFRETWFLGAPLPLYGRLYVIGETDGVLQLFVLESQTGRLLARQALAQPTPSLAASFVRRTYPLFPSASGGIILCPTGSGLLVALDAATLAPLWCFSYVPEHTPPSDERNPRNMWGNRPAMLLGLGGNVHEQTIKQAFRHSGWQVPSIMIDGRRILVAPPDREVLYCLDLLSGKLLWQVFISRTNALYVACVHKDKAFLVTPESLMTIDMHTGENLTTSASRFPEKLRPAGVGVHSGDQYFIPFTEGSLAVADLMTGGLTWLDASGTSNGPPAVAAVSSEAVGESANLPEQNEQYARIFTPDLLANELSQKPMQLGNLVGIKGRFFSQSPMQITSFDQKEPLRQQAEALLQANADDPDGLLKQGRILKSEGKLAEAIDAFRASFSAKPSVEAAEHLRKNLLEAMRNDYPAWRHAARELESLAEFPEEWAAILYAQCEGILQSGQTDELAAVLEKVVAFGQNQTILVPVSSHHSAQLPLAVGCLVEQSPLSRYSAILRSAPVSGVPAQSEHLSWSELPAPFVWKPGAMDVATAQPHAALSNEIDQSIHRLVASVKNPDVLRRGDNVVSIPFLGTSDSEPAAFSYVVRSESADVHVLCCLDHSGRERWRLTLPATVSLENQQVFPYDQRFRGNGELTAYIKGCRHYILFVWGRLIVAIDAAPQSEKILWSKTLSSAPISQRSNMRTGNFSQRPDLNAPFPKNAILVSPYAVYCWDANYVYALDSQTGQALWVRKVPHDLCTLLGDDANLFLVFPESRVRWVEAIDPVSGREMAAGPLPPGGTYIYGTNIVFIQKRGNDCVLSICDLRDIHDKRRRATLAADLPERSLAAPIPTEILSTRVRETSMLQTLKDDRFLSVGTWETKSLQIYDLLTKQKLLPDNNKILDFIEEKGLIQSSRMRCDVELVGDRILVLFTKNAAFQTSQNIDLGWGRTVRRNYSPVPGVPGIGVDDGIMMLFDAEGNPDPAWIGPGPMFDTEGEIRMSPDPHWQPGRPTKIKKIYRLLDVPDRLPFVLFAVRVSENDAIALRNITAQRQGQWTRIMAIDKRTGEYRFRKEFFAEHLPLQPFRVSADMEAQELILTPAGLPHMAVKMVIAD